MSCMMLFLLALVIMYFGALIAFFLAIGMVPLAILALVLIPLAIIITWRIIYPWLVRMGKWSAQLRNIGFLLFLMAVGSLVLVFILGLAGVSIPTQAIYILFGVLFVFLLLLAIAVWLVRLWRYSWPPLRNAFWDIAARVVALVWKMLLGIPLGIVWFLYHPPLRWLVAAILFYVRGVSAGIAWLLYNPPLRDLIRAGLFLWRLIARFIAWLLYNPPISWLVQAGMFVLRLIARFGSAVTYAIWGWWPIAGVRKRLRKGLTAESKSYQDYDYAHDDGGSAA
jgi:hypothetical protein